MGQVKQSGICPNSDNVTLSDIEQFTTVPRRTSLWSDLRRILYLRSPLPITIPFNLQPFDAEPRSILRVSSGSTRQMRQDARTVEPLRRDPHRALDAQVHPTPLPATPGLPGGPHQTACDEPAHALHRALSLGGRSHTEGQPRLADPGTF